MAFGYKGTTAAFPYHWQGLYFPLVELHEDSSDPFLQPVEVLPDGNIISGVSTTLQCCICTLADGTLCPCVQMNNEDVKQPTLLHSHLGVTISEWPPAVLSTANYSPLSPAVQPLFSSSLSTLKEALHQFFAV